MHRVDFRSSRRARADSFEGTSSTTSSSSSTRRRRSLSFGGHHRRRVSTNKAVADSKEENGDWCHKPNPISRVSQLRHLNIPLQHKRALAVKTPSLPTSSSHRPPPLTKIDEQYEHETNSIAVDDKEENEGAFPLLRETLHHSRSQEIEPTRTNSSKTRMDSVRVGEKEGGDVLLVQVPNEEAVEIVSLCLDGDEYHLQDKQQQQQRRQQPPSKEEDPLFLNLMGEHLQHHQNLHDTSMDTASVMMMDPGDKYSVQLFEECSVADGFDDSLSGMTPMTGPPPPSIKRSSVSEISIEGFSPIILVPHRRSKKVYPYNNSPASVLGHMSHQKVDIDDGNSIIIHQSESDSVVIIEEEEEDDESHYYDGQSTADSYSQATGSTVPFSQASTVAHQNSKNLVGNYMCRSSGALDRRMIMMDDTMSVDIDVINYVEDKYAMPRSSSTASYSVYTDASSVSSGTSSSMLTRSWQSGLTSVIPGLNKPLNISVADEFHDMAKEVSKNPVAFAKWLNPL